MDFLTNTKWAEHTARLKALIQKAKLRGQEITFSFYACWNAQTPEKLKILITFSEIFDITVAGFTGKGVAAPGSQTNVRATGVGIVVKHHLVETAGLMPKAAKKAIIMGKVSHVNLKHTGRDPEARDINDEPVPDTAEEQKKQIEKTLLDLGAKSSQGSTSNSVSFDWKRADGKQVTGVVSVTPPK